MLHISRLEVEGFGPYAAPAILEFPGEPGVTVVYGDNMRGKTSLMNAVVYAFFGEVRGSHMRRRSIVRATNRDNARAGHWGFRVALRFRHDGADYELVRRASPRIGVMAPVADEDFGTEVYLRRNGEPLGPAEADHALKRVLPREVARFFLFDGELLSEYEELLEDESQAAAAISAAIEQILGVPILRSARAHLNHLAAEASAEVARAAQRNVRTAAMGQALAQANERKAYHEGERSRLELSMSRLQEQKRGIDEYLRARERFAEALGRLDAARAAHQRAIETEAVKRAELKGQMRNAWRSLLLETVRAARADAEAAAGDAFASITRSLRLSAITTCHCGTCDQDVPAPVRARLDASIPPEAPERRAGYVAGAAAMARAAGLGRFAEADVRPAVEIIVRDLNAARIDRTHQADEITDIETALADADEETLRERAATLTDLARQLAATEAGIAAEATEIANLERTIASLTDRIAASTRGTNDDAGARERLLRAAAGVFGAAIEGYKQSLRARVEATGSSLFLRMTTEREDYAGLAINENYGLSIRHREGDLEEGASAAAQQVVALALMGALQANAPLQGPIVMDTPFSRLDPGHKANVVSTLPSMADQIILLVQEGEIARTEVRRFLGANLRREYALVRESARRTRIEEVR